MNYSRLIQISLITLLYVSAVSSYVPLVDDALDLVDDVTGGLVTPVTDFTSDVINTVTPFGYYEPYDPYYY